MLQLAGLNYATVAWQPADSKVLVIASDIARQWCQDLPGESTQGAGAVAMLVSQNPRILGLLMIMWHKLVMSWTSGAQTTVQRLMFKASIQLSSTLTA